MRESSLRIVLEFLGILLCLLLAVVIFIQAGANWFLSEQNAVRDQKIQLLEKNATTVESIEKLIKEHGCDCRHGTGGRGSSGAVGAAP